ncbi:DNA polymerase-3 subunit epsilon [[Luteovulum] sphaeroides subsp. megalophilum]|uniref:exonuclease domain-containing protein n=1 Tax=Cereibacter sphaeroides TaxID=1063 RepID=UPI000B631D5B|nr:exonuclease domain-containing protein [Cereibacter sphaeroides]SNT43531.1 DNA polymerase-3 subunit epsilon [[Luteovulum] sphaeroides subsp. megalophilum]
MRAFSWLFGQAARDGSQFEGLPSGRFRFIAVDVETATADPASICQIGLACIDHQNGFHLFSTLVDPEVPIDYRNRAIHGICDGDVRGMPRFPVAMAAMRELLEASPLVEHSSFDHRAFAAACARYGLPPLSASWHDSVRAARNAWPHLKGNGGHGLSSVCAHLALEFDHHDAGADAYACASIILAAEAETGASFADLFAPAPTARRQRSEPVRRAPSPGGAFEGCAVVFTGSLSLSRKEAADLAAARGMTVLAGVTKQTTLLVVGDQDLSCLAGQLKSSKHRKAEACIANGQPIRIIGEAEFLTMVQAG